MKRVIGTLLISALTISAGEYSREDILRHAFENSEALRQIDKDREISESIKKEYVGKAFPTVEGVANYSHKLKSYNPYDMDMGGGGSLSPAMDSTAPGYDNDKIIAGAFDQLTQGFSSFDLSPKKNSFTMGVQLTQPIFVQGKVVTGLRIAKVYAETIEQKYQAGQYSLAKEISNSYNGALLAQQNITIQQEAVELAQESHRLTVAKLSTGKGNVLDTLNTRFALQKAEFALRSAKKDKRLAVKHMLTVASLNADPDEVILTDNLEMKTLSLTEQEAFEKIKENNRNLAQLKLAADLQSLQTTLAKSDFLPSVVAGAAFMGVTQYNGMDEFDMGGDHKLYAAVQVPIFSGTQRVHKLRQANYEEEKLDVKTDEVTNQLRLALSASYEELAVAMEEHAEALEMVALTEKAFKVSTLAYEVGQITQLDLTNSEQQLSLARLAQNNAIYKVNTAITSIYELIAEPALIAVN